MAPPNFVFTIVALAVTIGHATALKCYSCDSSKGMTCNYGLLSFTYSSVECQVNSGSNIIDTLAAILPTQCAKLVGKDKEGKEYTARGCAPSTGPLNSCNAIAKFIQFADSMTIDSLDCYTCDTDNCNSATKIGGLSVLGLLVACLMFLV